MKRSKFGERFKELRDEKKLSQGTLAEVFNVSIQTISAWEKGIQETNFDTIIAIAEYFKVSTDYLLGVED